MLTIKTVSALKAGSVAWDNGKGAVMGFGVRRQKGDAIAYILKYRTAEGRQRWHTIGRHGSPWTPDEARMEARRILANVANGSDPAGEKQETRKAQTVSELCEVYLDGVEAGEILIRGKKKKPSTLATDKGRVERHIKPLLGRLKVRAVTSDDVERFRIDVTKGVTATRVKTGRHGLARVTGGSGAATRTMGLLGAIFSYAVKKKLRPDNPCRGVERQADGKRERRLASEEYEALGKALSNMPKTIWPMAIHATHFLAITGWRRGEVLKLKWNDVDLKTRTARLGDTKTGKSMRPLSHDACETLKVIPRFKGDLVFPSSIDFNKPMSGFHKTWLRIAAQANLPKDVTAHVLRHSFSSIAGDLGFSELTISVLIGHKNKSMTSRYIHHADAVLLAAADAVVTKITELMGYTKQDGVVAFKNP